LSAVAVPVEVVVVVLVSGSRVLVPRAEVVDVVSVVDVVATVVVVVTEVDVVASSPNTMAQLPPEHHLPEPSATNC